MARTGRPAATRSSGLLRRVAVMWVVCCWILGALVAWQIAELRSLVQAVDAGAVAIERTGGALEELTDAPLIGRQLEGAAGSVLEAADATRQAADEARQRIVLIAVVTGLFVALLPTLPIIGAFWVLDHRRERARSSARAALADAARHAGARRVLAEQARAHAHFEELLAAVSGEPDVDELERRLAALRLRMLGEQPDAAEALVAPPHGV